MLKAILHNGEVLGLIDDSSTINQHLILTLKGLGFTVEDAKPCPCCNGTGYKQEGL